MNQMRRKYGYFDEEVVNRKNFSPRLARDRLTRGCGKRFDGHDVNCLNKQHVFCVSFPLFSPQQFTTTSEFVLKYHSTLLTLYGLYSISFLSCAIEPKIYL
jgi:hypothetical protein